MKNLQHIILLLSLHVYLEPYKEFSVLKHQICLQKDKQKTTHIIDYRIVKKFLQFSNILVRTNRKKYIFGFYNMKILQEFSNIFIKKKQTNDKRTAFANKRKFNRTNLKIPPKSRFPILKKRRPPPMDGIGRVTSVRKQCIRKKQQTNDVCK